MSEQATSLISKELISNFLTIVRSQVTDLHGSSWENIEIALNDRMTKIIKRNKARIIDAPSKRWLLLASMILAFYKELIVIIKDEHTVFTLLRDTMAAPLKEGITTYIADRFGIAQDAPGEAFDRIAQNFKTRGEERFGQAYTYVQEVQDERRSFVSVQKCLINDFFRANQMSELALIFCAMDDVWADELSKPQYGVRFERPTTLARGDDMCRFQFSKTTVE